MNFKALLAATLVAFTPAAAMAGQTPQDLQYRCETLQQFEAEGNSKAAFWVRSAIVSATPDSLQTVTDMCAAAGVHVL